MKVEHISIFKHLVPSYGLGREGAADYDEYSEYQDFNELNDDKTEDKVNLTF
jgi:hypothetical protein